MDRQVLHVVTGAPGSGKSTVVETCIKAQTDFLVLDIDWLIDSASDLANEDIRFASSAWPAYNAMWLEVMHSILKNGTQAVLFAPFGPRDLKQLPPWCAGARWLLLDCPDEVLRQRLAARDWSERRVQGAIDDAVQLRTIVIDDVIDNSTLGSEGVVSAITRWLRPLDQ